MINVDQVVRLEGGFGITLESPDSTWVFRVKNKELADWIVASLNTALKSKGEGTKA